MQQVTEFRSILVVVLVLMACMAGGAAAAANQDASPGPSTAGERIDINRADVEGLIRIPGIGKSTAEKIIRWRDENGPFRRVEDLLKVKGIGEKSFQKIRPHVTVGKS